MHWILFYELVDDYLERCPPLREEHLGLARRAAERDELVLGGALAEPADRALLVFRSAEAASSFARSDPYVAEGLVKSWNVRLWNVVVGSQAG